MTRHRARRCTQGTPRLPWIATPRRRGHASRPAVWWERAAVWGEGERLPLGSTSAGFVTRRYGCFRTSGPTVYAYEFRGVQGLILSSEGHRSATRRRSRSSPRRQSGGPYDLCLRRPRPPPVRPSTINCGWGRWRCRSGEVAIEKATGPLGDVVGHPIFGEQARQLAEELAGASIIVHSRAYRT